MKKIISFFLAIAIILVNGLIYNPIEAFGIKGNYYNREVYTNRYVNMEYDILDYNIEYYDSYSDEIKNKKYDSLILVNEESLTSDGLSASGLVGITNGLLVPIELDGSMPSNVSGYLYHKDDFYDETYEYLPKKVYIIGGIKAISPSVDGKFKKDGCTVKRLQGKNRIETSYKIAEEIKSIKGNVNEMAVTKAYKGEADSVSIAYEAIKRKMPVILTNGSNLPSTSPLGAEVNKIYAIGGNAVLKDSLIKQLHAERIGGKDRYETNYKIIKKFGKREGCTIVSGKTENLGYALLASTMKMPIVMTKEKPDKYINTISEMKSIFFANEEIPECDESEFILASYGKEVFNAFRKIEHMDFTEIGLDNGYYFYYEPENNYLEGTNVNLKDYIIFAISEYDASSERLPYNIAVSRKNGRVYVVPEGHNELVDVTDLV